MLDDEEGGRRRLDRRQLLKWAARAGGGLPLLWTVAAARARQRKERPADDPAKVLSLSARGRRTLAAVQERLLPSGPGSPGAREVNATDYLLRVAAEPSTSPRERRDLRRGLRRVDALARETEGQPFAELPDERKDLVLRALQGGAEGEPFLELLLVYTLEALLGDPVYGGNPGEVGWGWLQHAPGSPRPARPWRPPA